jgi:cytochrome c oxidase subunit 1
MTYVTHDESAFVPPIEVAEPELYHAKTWIGKYVWSQDAKVIAVQYALTAIFVGLVALVLSGLMRLQLGFPHAFQFITPSTYLQFVTMHGMIMVIYLLTALFLGGFGNYLIPLMVGARDMVFPYVNMVSYWVYLFAVPAAARELLRPRRTDRCRLDAVSAAGDSDRHSGRELGNHPDARVARVLHHRLHDGRAQLRRDGAAGAHARHDDDAAAAHVWGIFMATILALLAFPGTVRERDHDDARPLARHELLHAGGGLAGQGARAQRRQPRCCSSTSSGSSAIPRSTSSRCRPSASCPISSASTRGATSSATG